MVGKFFNAYTFAMSLVRRFSFNAVNLGNSCSFLHQYHAGHIDISKFNTFLITICVRSLLVLDFWCRRGERVWDRGADVKIVSPVLCRAKSRCGVGRGSFTDMNLTHCCPQSSDRKQIS